MDYWWAFRPPAVHPNAADKQEQCVEKVNKLSSWLQVKISKKRYGNKELSD
jgi:hypothetical protein